MTELLLIACIAATVVLPDALVPDGRYIHLAATAASALLASLTRYEGWVLCVSVMSIVIYVVAWAAATASRRGPAGRTGELAARGGAFGDVASLPGDRGPRHLLRLAWP